MISAFYGRSASCIGVTHAAEKDPGPERDALKTILHCQDLSKFGRVEGNSPMSPKDGPDKLLPASTLGAVRPTYCKNTVSESRFPSVRPFEHCIICIKTPAPSNRNREAINVL